MKGPGWRINCLCAVRLLQLLFLHVWQVHSFLHEHLQQLRAWQMFVWLDFPTVSFADSVLPNRHISMPTARNVAAHVVYLFEEGVVEGLQPHTDASVAARNTWKLVYGVLLFSWNILDMGGISNLHFQARKLWIVRKRRRTSGRPEHLTLWGSQLCHTATKEPKQAPDIVTVEGLNY